SWLNPPVSMKFARVTLDSVEPSYAEDDERLLLHVSGGWLDGPVVEVIEVAKESTSLALPLTLHQLILPGGLPLDLHITMRRVHVENHLPKGGATVGTIHRIFNAPSYAEGTHTDVAGDLTAHYRIH